MEPDIGSIKCTLGLEHLRGQSPESLHRELWTGVLTYNLVRLKMLQSGYAAGLEIRSMSFTGTHLLLATNWLLCACIGVSEAMAVSAQQQGTCAVIGQRPDRVEPRENRVKAGIRRTGCESLVRWTPGPANRGCKNCRKAVRD